MTKRKTLKRAIEASILRGFDSKDAEIARLRAALEEISQPLLAMQKRAEAEGYVLNGEIALNIISNPQHYKSIARRALEQRTKPIKELQPHAYVPSVMHMGDCHRRGDSTRTGDYLPVDKGNRPLLHAPPHGSLLRGLQSEGQPCLSTKLPIPPPLEHWITSEWAFCWPLPKCLFWSWS